MTAAADCKELQHGHSHSHDWFGRLVDRTNDPELRVQLKAHDDGGDTAQGLYVAGPDGTSYGWYNGWRHTPELLQFLQDSLSKYKSSPPRLVQIAGAGLVQSSVLAPAASTMVVRVFSRIRPLPENADPLNESIGRDHLWLLADEARAILNQPDQHAVEIPPTLLARMTRYHLIDNVRGEPDAWEANEVAAADWRATIIGQTDSTNTYNFTGSFAMKDSGANRGYTGRISGQFDIDRRQRKFGRFRAIANGYAWGAGRFTLNPPGGRFPLIIGMLDVNDAVSRAVPPEFIGEDWTDDYLHPEISTDAH